MAGSDQRSMAAVQASTTRHETVTTTRGHAVRGPDSAAPRPENTSMAHSTRAKALVRSFR